MSRKFCSLHQEDFNRYNESRKASDPILRGEDLLRAVRSHRDAYNDYGPPSKLRQALHVVYEELAYLPFHFQVCDAYDISVCWICNEGGILSNQNKQKVSRGESADGVRMESTTDDPNHPMRMHMRTKRHKLKKRLLLNMTGCEAMGMEEKAEALLDKAAEKQVKHEQMHLKKQATVVSAGGKGNASSVSAEDQEEADLMAERAALERQLRLKNLREGNEAIRAKLSEGAGVTQLSAA